MPAITVDTPASDERPPIRIISIPQQREPVLSLASPETIITTNMISYNSAYRHDITGAPSTTLKEVEEKQRHPKFAEGTGKVPHKNGDEEAPLLCTSCDVSKICLPPMYNSIESSPNDQIPPEPLSIFRIVSLY
jgi:hypothetical protein